jgi:WD40 repeat protein
MPTATRTFRVFVSSTFEDLKAERDALQRDVFPKLRKLCEENGTRFQAVDLRWGVRDEAALDQQTMEICLREIERCQQTRIKPNFIVLLGDRYGWRPLPARIEAKEFDRVYGRIADADDRQLIDAWYERDDNAVPPEHLLKPRTGEFVDKVVWNKFEQRLHRILREAAREAGLTPESLIKYEVSATHQEILKGLGETEEDRKHVFAFFRDPTADIAEEADITSLKKYLREKLADVNIRSFPTSDSAELCADVEKLLKQVILAEAGKFKSRPALDLEIEAHETFAHDRAMHFTGRKTVLGAIGDHIRGGESRPLVVRGLSGCGKSAIIAKASAQANAEMPGAVLIQRFIGVTPDSSNGITLLHSLCEQLSRDYGVTEETPMGFQPLVVAFHDRMARATAERPLVLFLDALDQMRPDDEARSFTWLRNNLPPHVSLVVSTTEIPVGLQSAAQVAVGDFPFGEAEEVMAGWLRDTHRKLQPKQREKVLNGFALSGLPLYLKLAFEEARRWRSFDAADMCVVGNNVSGMIDVLFNRLSEESSHGPIIVNRSLGFLAAARYGLTEDEMLDVLADDDEVWKDFELRAHHKPTERRLPVIVWSRLFLDLEPYLNERAVPGGNVMAFYHRQVAERAAWLYLRKDEGSARHAELAGYFGKQSHWRNQGAMQANERKITELLQQQIGANAFAEVERLLTDLDFIAAKCAAGLLVDLELDYRDAIAALPEAQTELGVEAQRRTEIARWTKEIIDYARQWSARHDRVARGEIIEDPEPKLPNLVRSAEPWSEKRIEQEAERIGVNPTRLDRLHALQAFVQQEAYPLKQFGTQPGFAVQQAFNHAPRGPVHESANRALPAVAAPLLTRHWVARDQYNPKPALLRTLEGHNTSVNSVSVTADGRRAVSGSGDKPARVWDLRVWDLETGECLHVLEGHTDKVESVSVTPDGRRAVSGSEDKTLRVWDLESGQCLRVLEGHSRGVGRVSVTPDGRRAVSGGDGTLRVWDLESGECLRVLQGPGFHGVSVTADGRRAVSGSKDKMVRVWDLESGECLRVLEGISGSVMSVHVTADGRRAVSAGDSTLRVWDLESGQCLRVLEWHPDLVAGLSVTADGRRAISGDNGTLRVWDLVSGECLRTLEGHSHWVTSVSVTPDGRRVVSGSRDKTARVWDLLSGQCLPVLEGHSGSVESVSVTADGRRAISGSYDKTLRVWDLESGQCLRVLDGLGWEVQSVCVTPDGRRAISGSWDRTVRVWELESGQCLRVLEGHSDLVASLSVTADGRRAVSGSYDKTVRVWDVESGECLRVLEGHSGEVSSVSVTGDRRRAVSGSFDGTVRVWDLESGQCLHVLGGHCNGVNSVSVAPDGRQAVSGNGDHTLRVWDLETGECVHVLEGHSGWVRGVSVTPDGRRALSVSWDLTVRVWDLATGTCLAVARVPVPVNDISLSSILGRIVVGTSTGEVLQFDSHGMSWSCGG